MPIPSSVKQSAPTVSIPNPMHQFPSWTYNWSLWRLGMRDASAILSATDVGTGVHYQLTRGESFCVAEDSGLYIDWRHASQFSMNYNIQDVTFDTVVGLNSSSRSSNMVSGEATIIEPYGVTFLNTLIDMSFNPTTNKRENYLQQPYMLQLDFVGYNEDGIPLPKGTTSVYRKRFPISLIKMNMKVTKAGAEYHLGYVPVSQLTQQNKHHSKTPANFSVTAGTVSEFFDKFSAEMNRYFQEQKVNGKIEYADTMKFEFDDKIKDSIIVYKNLVSLKQADPNTKTITLDKNQFSIPAGTAIIDVIEKVVMQSEYIIEQLGLSRSTDSKIVLTAAQTNKLNWFKTTCRTTYQGADGAGALHDNVFDNFRNVRPLRSTYIITQFPVYEGRHPTTPAFLDCTKNIVKTYNYIYTGRNTDIINLNIDFNTTFYIAMAGYTNQVAADETTASTALYDKADGPRAITINPTPQYLASTIVPQLGSVPNASPLVLQMIANDRTATMGYNILSNPGAQYAVNVAQSLYSKFPSGDMINIDLQIVGDPTLIKQDDVLYTPSPNSAKYGNWNVQSQSSFCSENGHVRMDAGELVCYVNISTPVDIDTDFGDRGLMWPQQQGQIPSLFSGYYRILQIKNVFRNGQFTQNLNLVRYSHSEYVKQGAAGGNDIQRAGGDGTWSI